MYIGVFALFIHEIHNGHGSTQKWAKRQKQKRKTQQKETEAYQREEK